MPQVQGKEKKGLLSILGIKKKRELDSKRKLTVERLIGVKEGKIENLRIDDIVIKKLSYRGRDKLDYYECQCKCGGKLLLNSRELSMKSYRVCGMNKLFVIDDNI